MLGTRSAALSPARPAARTSAPARAVRPAAPSPTRYAVARLADAVRGLARPSAATPALNARLRGYPRNHDYIVTGGRDLLPSRRLRARWTRVAELYPHPLTSLLDVGSCKGYFVLEAARRPSCRSAVGIDVYEPFVTASRDVARHLAGSPAAFHLAPLDVFAADPALSAGAPFQTILLLNLYHYLFAGSDISPLAYRDHRPILSLLYTLCSDRVIFSSPLDLSECPDQVQTRAAALGVADRYTRDAFLDAADEFFRVEDHGLWGKRPLLVLRHRPRPLPLTTSV